jgi:DnaK suppressor protein
MRRSEKQRAGPGRRAPKPAAHPINSAFQTPATYRQDVTDDPGDVLRAERARTADQVDALRREHDDIVQAAALVATDDEHDPEGATIAFERSRVAALIEQSQNHLVDLDHALAELADGRYGRCEGCGDDIGAERLAARPSARTCISCARRRAG